MSIESVHFMTPLWNNALKNTAQYELGFQCRFTRLDLEIVAVN